MVPAEQPMAQSGQVVGSNVGTELSCVLLTHPHHQYPLPLWIFWWLRTWKKVMGVVLSTSTLVCLNDRIMERVCSRTLCSSAIPVVVNYSPGLFQASIPSV